MPVALNIHIKTAGKAIGHAMVRLQKDRSHDDYQSYHESQLHAYRDDYRHETSAEF